MSNHTPGPWSLPHFVEPDTNCMCGYVLTGGMFGAVCTVHASGEGDDWQAHGDNPKFAEAVANARLIAAAPKLKEALAAMLDFWGGYECPEVDAAIAVMQEIGEDRWSMQAQMEAAKAEGGAA